MEDIIDGVKDYKPTDKIKGESLAEFERYKDSDWMDQDNLKKIIDHFKSIAY